MIKTEMLWGPCVVTEKGKYIHWLNSDFVTSRRANISRATIKRLK